MDGNVTRRDFLKLSGVALLAAAAGSILTGCGGSTEPEREYPIGPTPIGAKFGMISFWPPETCAVFYEEDPANKKPARWIINSGISISCDEEVHLTTENFWFELDGVKTTGLQLRLKDDAQNVQEVVIEKHHGAEIFLSVELEGSREQKPQEIVVVICYDGQKIKAKGELYEKTSV